jgi:hypothetical protein
VSKLHLAMALSALLAGTAPVWAQGLVKPDAAADATAAMERAQR